ncbi:MAG: hypothetical protein EA387_05020 [Nitriliruptor sp.]|nr:MAG: hypothetical protein EA387_05020 [Nitriliruptor sp.]
MLDPFQSLAEVEVAGSNPVIRSASEPALVAGSSRPARFPPAGGRLVVEVSGRVGWDDEWAVAGVW